MTSPGQPTTKVVDGQTVDGTYGPDGTFYSEDGTIVVLPDGTIEHGVTDPDTDVFLENGEVLTINGVQVYGSVQDGTFYSEDGTIVVLPDGTIEHGVTDPATGVFLENGEVRTINGVQVYGTVQDGTFISEDGTIIVLPDGTVLTGTLDPNTGIFTASNGADYFLGENGVVPATPESDGSYELPDGSVVMTPQAWSVDLPQLADAITQVSTQRDLIRDTYQNSIVTTFNTIEEEWQSPASATFTLARFNFDVVAVNLLEVLDDAISRMQVAYQNYLSTETTNTGNLQ
jgi:hypothetical protein